MSNERLLKQVMLDINPTMMQLQQYTAALSNNIAVAADIVAECKNEEAFKKQEKVTAYNTALIMYQDEKNATIVKAKAENDPEVQRLSRELLESSAKVNLALAKLQGYDAQYTAAKKIIEARIKEIRGGVGGV